ncbi:hypothetical protein CPB97_010207 [Podila verticillata]|nr:hypothetical protein CPB97_010207 [Podila verticillata]
MLFSSDSHLHFSTNHMSSSPEAKIQVAAEPPVAEVYTSTAKPRAPLTDKEWANMDKPKVLIVGAGIGGLFLGNLLHKAEIPFLIFDRAHEVKNLGSVMSLGSSVSTLFEQLGMLEDLKKIGKPNIGLEVFNDDRTPTFYLDFSKRPRYCGAEEYLVSRPDLYDLFLRQVPKENIHMGKKVLNFEQNDLGVMIRCNDNTSYHGDILVGADGAYSAVRQHLYKVLKGKKLLPSVDEGDLPFDCICLVGQTEVLDPEDFPDMKLPHSKFNSVLGDEAREFSWGPEAAEAMCKKIRHFRCPGGKDGNLTLGDLIDKTPKHLISKVMLEEKLNPSGGAGALTAIHDTVTLANWIATLHKPKLEDIEAIFAEYQDERLPVAREAVATTKFFKSIGGKSIAASLSKSLFRNMPRWLLRLVLIKMVAARPQVSFLPLVEDKGSKKPIYQPSLEKTLAIHKARAAKKQTETGSSEAAVAI